jgi:hypothetical protein
MAGDVPFGAFDLMCRGVMALVALARVESDREPWPIWRVFISQRSGVFTARAVAILTLDVGEILQRWRHGRKVAIGLDGWENPARLGCDVIKACVDSVRVRIVTDCVTSETGLAVMTQETVNAFGEDLGVPGGLPCRHFVGGNNPTAMTQGTGV